MNVLENYVLPSGRTLGLKVVYEDGRPESPNAPKEFKGWNLELGGLTEAPDWIPIPYYGRGLHLWEWAQGGIKASTIWHRPDVTWMAVEYETSTAVGLFGKVKVPKARTIAVSSDRKEIISFIQKHTPEEKRGPAVDEGIIEVEEGDVTVGDGGIAIVRGKGTATAGHGGDAIAGDGGIAIVGGFGRAVAGAGGTASAGVSSSAIAGDNGTARVGNYGGTAEAGKGGTAIAGIFGYAWVGKGGKAKVGKGGRLYLQNSQGWIQLSEGSNIKPDTFYKLDDLGNPVEVGE